MGYLVMTSGRLLLPEDKERAALPVLSGGGVPRSGSPGQQGSPPSLEELAGVAGARAVRDGDWILLATDKHGDPKWSERATAFYAALAPWVTEGEVRFTGEDGAKWSYRYSPTGVDQDGVNGWDGSSAPAAVVPPAMPTEARDTPPPFQVPAASTPEWPPASAPQGGAATDPFWAADAPATQSSSRTFAMAALLVAGVFCIIMIAMLAAGVAG